MKSVDRCSLKERGHTSSEAGTTVTTHGLCNHTSVDGVAVSSYDMSPGLLRDRRG